MIGKNIKDNNNGTVEIKQNGIEYTVWTHAKVVRKYIKEHLKKLYPGKLIINELNKIDLSIPENNMPVEIQATVVDHSSGIRYARWEDHIRRQIEQNIVNYDECIFFFDSELLMSMKDAGRGISINMDWFRKLMKEEKLTVYTISYKGYIEKKEYKDFDFLSDISRTCPIAAETDAMILNRNKLKIFAKVIKGHKFTQEEIDRFDNDYEEYCKTNIGDNDYKIKFLLRQTDKRSKLYGNILRATSDLSDINRLLYKDCSNYSSYKHAAMVLGILYMEGSSTITKFIDRFDICKYFPVYLKNKEIWDKLRGLNFNTRQFANIMTGKNDVINGLDYYFNENNDIKHIFNGSNIEINNKDKINDKDINIKIDSNDHLIDINIKTKQKTIEDSWN